MQTETTQQTSMTYLMANYANYHLWAHVQLIEWLKEQPQELMEAKVPSSFPSIRETLLHSYETQRYWLSVIDKTSDETRPTFTGSTQQLFDEMLDHCERIAQHVEAMSLAQMEKNTLIINPWFQCDFQNFEYIMQLVNHGTYHRGQITAMSHQLGITGAPNTDYNFYNVRGK